MVCRNKIPKKKRKRLICFSLAVAYGQGCYFAKDSVYSHSYAPPDRSGIRRMFLGKEDFTILDFDKILIV